MRKSGPNWGLAFGSGSFLLVFSIGLLGGIDVATVAVRAALATFLGACMGLVIEKLLNGISAVQAQASKGGRVDFTLPASNEEVSLPLLAHERSAVVPRADDLEGDQGFEPIDFKKAARQVQGMLND